MTATAAPRPKPGVGFGVGVAAAAIVGIPLGLYGTALSLVPMWLVGGVLAVVGGIAAARRRRWGIVLAVLGGAVLLGFAAYIGLGLLLPDGPSSGEGHG